MLPQSKTPLPWTRYAAWTGGALVLLGCLAYFGASVWLNHYLHGETFRTLINHKTSALLDAEGEYTPIQREGFSFYSDSYTAWGKAGAPLKELRADQIRAEFEPAAVFSGAWQVSSLQIQRLKIALGNLQGPAAKPASFALSPVQNAPETPRSRWIPDRFELKSAHIEEAEMQWSWPGREGKIRRVRLKLEPDGRDVHVTGYGGRLEQAGWPALSVDYVKFRYRVQDIFLTDSLFHIGESESVSASGQVGLGQNRTVDLLTKFSGISITPFLPVDWRAGVKGRAVGESHITGSLDQIDEMRAAGTLQLTGGQLEALPILEKIATFTRTWQFRQFALQKAEAAFVYEKSKLTVSRLIAESEGLVRIEGGFTVENGIVQGTFQLGVTPSSLQWLPGSRQRVFTQNHDGYAWTTVKISGPPDRINEDLSSRLAEAAGMEVIEGVKGTLENGAKNLFDLLKPLTN